jgi:GNAT superfamily N-acetyltransferase
VTIAISDLRDQPQFRDAVADRVWRTWWRERGVPLDELRAWVDVSLDPSPIPMALVAHEGDVFAGTASVIVCDLAERSQFTPWVAALWVEPEFRMRRVGHALVARAAAIAFAESAPTVYLCAREHLHGFYQRQGWTLQERDIGEHRLGLFRREASQPGTAVA